MNTTFILLRHGETDWNREERLQGHTDIPLNQNGRNQAKKAALYLSKVSINTIYTSPLLRAHETATIIRRYHPETPLIPHNSLKERRFGQLEGKTYGEVNSFHPALIFSNSWHYPEFLPPGGERLIDVYYRVEQFRGSLQKKGVGTTVLVVGHGAALQILIGQLLDIPISQLARFTLSNSSLSVISYSQDLGGTIHLLNHTFHLDRSL